MSTLKKIDFHVADSVGRVNLTDEDGENIATMCGGTSRAAQDLAQEIADRYDAPLIILGMVQELRNNGDDHKDVQWSVIYEGERKLMTSGEIADVQGALGFVE